MKKYETPINYIKNFTYITDNFIKLLNNYIKLIIIKVIIYSHNLLIYFILK